MSLHILLLSVQCIWQIVSRFPCGCVLLTVSNPEKCEALYAKAHGEMQLSREEYLYRQHNAKWLAEGGDPLKTMCFEALQGFSENYHAEPDQLLSEAT